MEGKGVIRAVIMGLLILGLVVAQIEAKSCCMNTKGRNCFFMCRLSGDVSRPICASVCDCIIISGHHTCPSTHPSSDMLENSEDDVIEQVTTDLEASRPGPTVICLLPAAKACFRRCRMAPQACAENCGCIYVPPRLDLN